MKFLIIAAHPDDEVLGCGGVLSKYYDDEKMLIILTDGESSRNNDNNSNFSFNRNILIENNIKQMLNIKYFNSGKFPDNKLDSIPLLDIIKFIEKHTKSFFPDIIFTHHPDCLNIDHAITYRAVITAFRPQHGISQQIYSFYIPSSTNFNPLNNFCGNVYFKLEQKDVDKKIECLKIYKNELRDYPHSRSLDNIINLMKVWGSEIGTNYCEKFQLIRNII